MTKLIRIQDVSNLIGLRRSTIYERIKSGLLPKPVKLGIRASAWPEYEITAYNQAIIKGQSDEEIRQLVKHLHHARTA